MTVEGPRDWHASVVGMAPELVANIDRLVAEIALDVARQPPLQLLFNARRHYEFELRRGSTEATGSSAEVLAHRMIEYIQSMIAATPPDPEPSRQVSEEDWRCLRRNVASLYESLDQYLALPILTTERRKAPATDRGADLLQHRLQTLWLYVRGKRYYAHIPEYLEEMFLPHTGLLSDTFGIDGELFVEGFKALLNSLTLGQQDAYRDLEELWQEVVVAASLAQPAPTGVLDRLEVLGSLERLRGNEDWVCRYERLRGQIVGMDLYDVERVTGLPRSLLKELSWSPGEDRDFFSEGARRGWPLRPLPVFKRPFVRIGGRSYCLHAQAVFDHLYRVVQRAVAGHGKSAQERWNRGQMEMSERLVLKSFERLLPGAQSWSSVYYRAVASNGRLEWCETDGVVAFDDHLFVIECRAGSFTYTDPSADFGSHLRSMLNLVSKPAIQGERFVDYLNSAESVKLFDRNHRPVGTLSKASFRCVTVCAVTLDVFTEIAARVRRLEGLGVGLGNATVWSLSIDDLRVFADVFSDPMVFLHFVEERRRSFGSTVLWCDDELEYLGLYLKHGRFVEDFESRVEAEDRIVFPDVTAEIDQFFDETLLDPKAPCELIESHRRVQDSRDRGVGVRMREARASARREGPAGHVRKCPSWLGGGDRGGAPDAAGEPKSAPDLQTW